jgi:hypothetical protein
MYHIISTPEKITSANRMSACMGIMVITDQKTKRATIDPATAKICLIVFSFLDAFR